MTLEPLHLLTILSLALAGAALAGCAVLAARLRRLHERVARELEPLSRDLRALCAAGSRAGDRLLRVEGEARRLRERQERNEMSHPGSPAYRQAIALVQRGADPDELVATCGMARGEAELMCLLHGSGERAMDSEKAH